MGMSFRKFGVLFLGFSALVSWMSACSNEDTTYSRLRAAATPPHRLVRLPG